MDIQKYVNEAKSINNTLISLLDAVSSRDRNAVKSFKEKYSFPECIVFNMACCSLKNGVPSTQEEQFIDSLCSYYKLGNRSDYYFNLHRNPYDIKYQQLDNLYGHEFSHFDSMWVEMFKIIQGAGKDVINPVVAKYSYLLLNVINEQGGVSDQASGYVGSLANSYQNIIAMIQNKTTANMTQRKQYNNYNSANNVSYGSSTQSVNSSYSMGSRGNSSADLPLKVTKFGGTTGPLSRDGDCTVSVGADIVNPNPSKMAGDVRIEITLCDLNGNVVDVINDDIYSIDANSTFHYGTEKVWANGRTANIKVNAYATQFVPVQTTFLDATVFSNFSINTDRSIAQCDISGYLKSNYTVPVRGCRLYYQVLNSRHEIIGGNNEFVDYLAPNQTRSICSHNCLTFKDPASLEYSVEIDVVKNFT